MLRRILPLLALFAFILAPMPVSAITAPEPVAAAAADDHCASPTMDSRHMADGEEQGEEKPPCCDGAMSGHCCPVAAGFARSTALVPGSPSKSNHFLGADAVRLGFAIPPPMEPPTLA